VGKKKNACFRSNIFCTSLSNHSGFITNNQFVTGCILHEFKAFTLQNVGRHQSNNDLNKPKIPGDDETRIYFNNKIHLRISAATMVFFNLTDSDSDPTIQQPYYNSSQVTTV
jgi:hypothetical protein